MKVSKRFGNTALSSIIILIFLSAVFYYFYENYGNISQNLTFNQSRCQISLGEIGNISILDKIDNKKGIQKFENANYFAIPNDRGINIWNYDTGKKITYIKQISTSKALADSEQVATYSISPTDPLVAIGSSEPAHASDIGSLKIWNIETKKIVHTINRDIGITNIDFSPDGTQLAYAANGKREYFIEIIDVNTGNKIKRLDDVYALDMKYSPDGRFLAYSNSAGVSIWEVDTDQTYDFPEKVASAIWKFEFSSDSNMIAAWADSPVIILWNLDQQSYMHLRENENIADIEFSPNGKYMAVGFYEGSVQIWDMGSVSVLLNLEDYPNGARELAFHPQNSVLASANGDSIRLWDVENGSKLADLRMGAFWVVFSPDGKLLLATNALQTWIWGIPQDSCQENSP